ncbi:hypothetical protein Tco_0935958 [Tanacetum coccineum]
MGDQVRDKVSREIPSEENLTTTGVIPELEKEVAIMGPRVNKRRHKRSSDEAKENAPPKVLRKDHAIARPEQSTYRGKSLASIGLEAGTTCVTPVTQEALSGAKSVSDPYPLSYLRPQPHLKRDMAQSSKETTPEISSKHVAATEAQGQTLVESPDQYNVNLARKVAMGSQLRLGFKQEARLLKKATTKIAKRDQRIQAMNLESLLEAELSQQVSTLQAQVTGKERIKAAFEEFKIYEDEWVNSLCVEMDA